MKKLSFLLIVLSISYIAQSQQTPVFQSAEEKIVFNKANQLDKYDGVAIEYTFQVIVDNGMTQNDLDSIAQKYFMEVLAVDAYQADGLKYISVLTNGKRSNHQGSFDLVDTSAGKFEFESRTYHLKH